MLEPREVTRAQVGPRELKDPRSKAYAIQTLYALKRYAESLRCDEVRVAKELAEIERYRHWEVLGYPSKDALLEAELSVAGILNVSKVTAILQSAPDLLTASEAGKKGGRGKRVSTMLSLSSSSGDPSRLAARLRRDHPDIYARLEAGEFSSIRAAARCAGIFRDKTPLQQLRHWWVKASPDERAAFIAEYGGPSGPNHGHANR